MLIAAAAAGAASTLYDSLTARKPAAQPDAGDAMAATQPAKRAKAAQPLAPAVAKLVSAAQSMLLGVQAGAG